jgi:tripartite-type tricarboxylate transporter receptor subunit TctC
MAARPVFRLTLLACLAFAPQAASALDYPNRPVRVLVTFAPGGAPDLQSEGINLPARDRAACAPCQR